jgi:hypothetical protein
MVRSRMAELNGTDTATSPASQQFEWTTPERIRAAVMHQGPSKKTRAYGMTNAQIIRALRKGRP